MDYNSENKISYSKTNPDNGNGEVRSGGSLGELPTSRDKAERQGIFGSAPSGQATYNTDAVSDNKPTGNQTPLGAAPSNTVYYQAPLGSTPYQQTPNMTPAYQYYPQPVYVGPYRRVRDADKGYSSNALSTVGGILTIIIAAIALIVEFIFMLDIFDKLDSYHTRYWQDADKIIQYIACIAMLAGIILILIIGIVTLAKKGKPEYANSNFTVNLVMRIISLSLITFSSIAFLSCRRLFYYYDSYWYYTEYEDFEAAIDAGIFGIMFLSLLIVVSVLAVIGCALNKKRASAFEKSRFAIPQYN